MGKNRSSRDLVSPPRHVHKFLTGSEAACYCPHGKHAVDVFGRLTRSLITFAAAVGFMHSHRPVDDSSPLQHRGGQGGLIGSRYPLSS